MNRPAHFSKLTPSELAAMFADPLWSTKFPPILSVDQSAELAQVPKETIYTWSSQGRMKGCSTRAGKYLRIFRNKFLQSLLDGDFHGNAK